ncbi:hypothetical protein B0H14DRAFT_3472012 [Mycena olivaceomarginata]|nr:hypothetical protein B0H14DRAFT_3472012 [Mycena olivaceomarginata]
MSPRGVLLWYSVQWPPGLIKQAMAPSFVPRKDVGAAVKLLGSIVELRNLDPTEFDPSERVEFEALCILAEVYDALLQPFINPDLSLSQQIESLTKFSHLICALYLENGTAFPT